MTTEVDLARAISSFARKKDKKKKGKEKEKKVEVKIKTKYKIIHPGLQRLKITPTFIQFIKKQALELKAEFDSLYARRIEYSDDHLEMIRLLTATIKRMFKEMGMVEQYEYMEHVISKKKFAGSKDDRINLSSLCYRLSGFAFEVEEKSIISYRKKKHLRRLTEEIKGNRIKIKKAEKLAARKKENEDEGTENQHEKGNKEIGSRKGKDEGTVNSSREHARA